MLIENARLEEMGRRVQCVRDADDSDEVRNDQKQSTTVTSGGLLINRELMQRGLSQGGKASSKPNQGARGWKRPAALVKPQIRPYGLRPRESTSRRVPLVPKETTQTEKDAKLHASSDHLKKAAAIELPTTEKTPANGLFQGSSVTLCSTDQPSVQRSISVATRLASQMKTHQIEAIRFMWDKVCADLALATTYEEAREEKAVGGAILAHFMGLGKTAGMFTKCSSPCFPIPGVFS